ncbi:MAG: protease pro-enzyme activation domain-containing protein [Verrucomicrobiota bacterium]
MKPETFPPAGGPPSGTHEPACPVVSSAAARGWFFYGKDGSRSWAILLAFLVLFGSKKALADERQQLQGHQPEAIRRMNLQPVGELPATNRLNLAIGLPARNRGDLTGFLRQLYDPTSANYRKFITPEQFTQRFGPSQEDYDKLKNFFTAKGLKVTGLHPNRTLLDVNLSVADIQRVFHVNLRVYQHPAEPRTFFAPDAEPSIDLDLPILHVSGLDNYQVTHPLIRKGVPLGQNTTNKALLGSGPDGSYFGYDFRAAYAPGVTLDGSGQSLALVEFDTYYPSDIATYEAQAGLPNIPLVNIPVDGFTGAPGAADLEVSLDIEVAVAMAPGLSSILVYEAPEATYPMNDILNKIATDNLAHQVSMSWELFDDPSTDLIFQQMAAQGQSFFEGSGDEGSFNYASTNQTQQSDDPYITLVGGTTLSTAGPRGAWKSETVWNWQVEYPGQGITGASGGGISTNYALPVWQQGINMSSNSGSTNFRNVPDVAMAADNIYVVDEDGVPEVGVGGTSVATPLWAAFCAMVNEKAALTGGSPMGFINPAIYALAKGPLYTNTFHDITTGNNTNIADPTNYFAVPGYDLCTGWGTPTGQALIDALVPTPVFSPILADVTNILSGGNGSGNIDPDGCYNLNVLVTNQGNATATGVQGILSSLTPGVVIGTSTVSFTNIPPEGSAQNQTAFTVSSEPSFLCGTPVLLQLVLKCNQTIQTNYVEFVTGAIGAPVRFDNSTPLSIPLDGAFSPITVSNIGMIGKVTVSLYLTTPEDEFMELYLMSPGGTFVYLALEDGGTGANFGIGCSPDANRTTFDDAATQSILTGTAPLVGTYSPVTALSSFSMLSGPEANGIWELYAYNLEGEATTLQCWSLFISPEQCPDGGGQCPGADLSITMSASPLTTPTGGPVTYTLSVSNAGPSPAPNTVVNQTLPSGIVYEGSVSSQGTISQNGSILTFSLGTVGIQSNATITVTTQAATNGLLTSTAIVGSTVPDPNPDNNQASASVLVTKPMADLAVTMSASPVSVPESGQATFLVTVTNNGPATALGVTLANSLPPNVNVVSAGASQGSVSANGTLASIGLLPAGSGATETLVLSPTVVGTCTLTSTAGLDPSETDPVLGNNTASVSINVVPAADLGVSVAVSPSPAISGGDIAYLVTVTNGGPATATSVIMNQTLPAGATFVSTSRASAVDQNGVVTWTITSNMPGGTSQMLTTTVKAPTLLQGVVSNVLVSTFSVFGQPGDPNTNNNYLSVSTLVLRPTEIIIPIGDQLTSESSQPPNGAVNPGETVGVKFELQNIGNIPTTNLVATLQTNGGVIPMQTNAAGVPVPGQSSASYSQLAPGGGSGYGQFLFSNNAAYGGTIVATLQLQDGPTNLGAVSFTFVLPVVSTFWNTNVIFIPATNFVPFPAEGPAGPDPSSNLVSGISAYVSDVAVTVSNLEHTDVNDINLLLVGPGGQSSILMCGAAHVSTASSPVTLTFDQKAANVVPGGYDQGLISGIYMPAEYNSPVFTNATNLSPPYNTNLFVFEGIPPNGWWYLYAYDGAEGDYGAISNGWCVAITTITPVNQITDVGVAIAASATNVTVGSNVTFTITVTNSGANATYVSLTNVLAAGLSFVSNTIPAYTPYLQTNLTPTNQEQIYNLGALAGQTNLTLGFVAEATAISLQTNTVVDVGSSLTDPNTNNNTAVASVTVVLPNAVVSPAITASTGSNAVVLGSNVIYTLTVTNNGTNLATDVIGLLTQGVPGSSTTVFSNEFASIAPGFIATAQFTNAPVLTGLLTNTWTVYTTNSTDTNHSAASLVLAITAAEPVIVANGARLISESFAPPDGAIDSNETVTIAFTLENIGAAPATNLTAALLSGNGVVPITSSQTYGVIAPGASAAANFSFTGQGAPGSALTAVLSLRDTAYSLGTVSFPFTIANPMSFTNSALIIIPDSGPGTPYPSEIAVSTTNGVVGGVTATLQDFTHSFPSDVNVLLVSPSGQQTVLMAHAGGPYSVTNLVLAFNGAATNSLPQTSLVSATNSPNHPTQYRPLDSFPGISGQPSNTNLNVFYGGNPNGIWSLYVYDDKPGNDGSIGGGWTLGLTLVNPINPPGSLSVGMTHAPDPVFTDNFLTFQITVTNLGLSGATNVILADALPAASSLVWAASTQGTINTNVAGAVAFNLGVLTNAGDTAGATIEVQPLLSGLVSNSVTVTNAAGSGAAASNTATVTNATPFSLEAAYLAGNLTLTLEKGSAGQLYIIQVSTNLASWTSLSTNIASGAGQFTITNNVANAPARFYRILHLPQ